ncbi:MAG: DUF4258 domain-containing protein [Oscillospiraceae bacterium]|nr:DUF4258 domain-containing protein [Oscillospiraceae bacterium]
MLNISDLQNLCNDKNIAVTSHVRKRFVERGITINDIKNAIGTGIIIEQYENDKPFPSCLLLGLTEQNKYIHTVTSIGEGYLYFITAYYPDTDYWEEDLKTRKVPEA